MKVCEMTRLDSLPNVISCCVAKPTLLVMLSIFISIKQLLQQFNVNFTSVFIMHIIKNTRTAGLEE